MEKGVNGSEPAEIEFRPVEESDFPTLTAWLAEPHVRRFYQKTPVTLEQVALEYGPFVRGRGADDLPLGDQRGRAVRLSAMLPQRGLSGVGRHHRGERRDQCGSVRRRTGIPSQRLRTGGVVRVSPGGCLSLLRQ